MFEVKRIETANKTFRLPVELIEKLQNTAQAQNVSMYSLVIQCCEYALNNLHKTEKDTKADN